MRESVPPFYIQLEVIASPCTTGDAVRDLCRIADRLGLIVEANISGITVHVYPGTDGDRLAESYTEAQRRGVKWMSSNILPGGTDE